MFIVDNRSYRIWLWARARLAATDAERARLIDLAGGEERSDSVKEVDDMTAYLIKSKPAPLQPPQAH